MGAELEDEIENVENEKDDRGSVGKSQDILIGSWLTHAALREGGVELVLLEMS